MSTDLSLEFEFRNQRFNSALEGLTAFATAIEVDVARAGPVLSQELRKFLDGIATEMAQKHGSGWPGGTTETSLSKRTGNLVNAIKQSVRVTGTKLSDIQGHIGLQGVSYGAIHEFGGTIRAKSGKYLAIPLPAALNSDGTPKRNSARDWDRTFVITSKAGNLLIVQRNGKDLLPLYVLKPEVKIKPRLGLSTALAAGLPRFVDIAIAAMMKEIRS